MNSLSFSDALVELIRGDLLSLVDGRKNSDNTEIDLYRKSIDDQLKYLTARINSLDLTANVTQSKCQAAFTLINDAIINVFNIASQQPDSKTKFGFKTWDKFNAKLLANMRNQAIQVSIEIFELSDSEVALGIFLIRNRGYFVSFDPA